MVLTELTRIQHINSCENPFGGILLWPKYGSTFQQWQEAINRSSNRDTGELLSIGLAEPSEPATDCCDQPKATGIVQLLGSAYVLVKAEEEIWQRLAEIDPTQLPAGTYQLATHRRWLHKF